MRDDHDVSGHDGFAPAERLLSRAADGATARGRPLSRRARQTQRSVEAYLKAGVRPRWMERVDEIDQGMRGREAAPRPRLPGARRRSAAQDPSVFARALARARAVVALRPPQRAHRAAQRLVSDRAPAPDGPAHRRLRALRGALLPPADARPGAGSSSTSPPKLDVSGARPRGQAPRQGKDHGRHACSPTTAGPGGARLCRDRRRPAPHHPARVDRGGRRRDRRAAGPGQRPGGAARRPRRQGRQRGERAGAGHAHVRLPAGHRHRRRPARSARPLRRTPSAASSTPRSPSATAATRRSSPSRPPSR